MQFKTGVLASEVVIKQVYDSYYGGNRALEVSIAGTTDKITINGFFYNDDPANAYNPIQQIKFSDGTTWDTTTLQAMLAGNMINGTTGPDVLTGTANADRLLGLDANDTLIGGAGHDWLDGGAGNDSMAGGSGNDVYVVDSTFDVVTELANEGNDTVRSSVNWTLGDNLENLVLTGALAINGTGNAGNNRLFGNAANNVLDGGAGVDVMAGGAGNDSYAVDSAADIIIENTNEGIDTVLSAVTLTLGDNLENLILTGTTAINGTGNSLDNVLTGNSGVNTLTGGAGNDRLDGKAGADKLFGGMGNDIYIVDSTADLVIEKAGEGTDTVMSAVSFALGDNVENLILSATPNIITKATDKIVVNFMFNNMMAINGMGNGLDNNLTGNSAANTLTGGAGNDILDGGAGNDTLDGGSGNDTYLFGRGSGQDKVDDFDPAGVATDVMSFGNDIKSEQLWFRQAGSDLEISINGTKDKSTIRNWYAGSAYHVEQFKTTDGKTLLDSQVDALVSAMAAFAPPAAGQTTLPPDYQAALAPVIAANWK